MSAYTSNELNEEVGMTETRLKISSFEIFRCSQNQLDHGISLNLLKRQNLENDVILKI